MAEPAKARRRPTVEAVPSTDPRSTSSPGGDGTTNEPGTRDTSAHEPATCPVAWCPVCLAVTAVQPVRPEVVEHLLKAGTEFLLALRSLIDARADDLGASGTREDRGDGSDGDLHRIDIG